MLLLYLAKPFISCEAPPPTFCVLGRLGHTTFVEQIASAFRTMFRRAFDRGTFGTFARLGGPSLRFSHDRTFHTLTDLAEGLIFIVGAFGSLARLGKPWSFGFCVIGLFVPSSPCAEGLFRLGKK